jgi:hypothetical protein
MPRTKNNDTQANIRLPSDLARQAKKKARAQRRTLSDVIRDLLRSWLGQ